MTDATDIFNNSYETEGQGVGVILMDNGKQLIILTEKNARIDKSKDKILREANEEAYKILPVSYTHLKSSNTPFTSMELTGKVKYTVCGGNVIYSDK